MAKVVVQSGVDEVTGDNFVEDIEGRLHFPGGTAGAGATADVTDRIGRLLGKTTFYDVLVNGTLGALNSTVSINCAGLSTVGVGITGTWAGTITAEVTFGDGVWRLIPIVDILTGTANAAISVNGGFLVGVAGALTLRIKMFAYTSGTATIYLEGTAAPGGVSLVKSIPTGTNSIGTVGLNTGNNNVGRVGSEGISISQTPTVTAGAYSAGDAVGGLLTFANAARVAGYGGVVKDTLIIDDAGQDAQMELWLFNTTFSGLADNAPWAPNESDLNNLAGIISTSDGSWFAAGTPSVARVEVSQRYDCTGTSLSGQLVTRGTPTFTATDDVTVIIGLLQD
jgi:hypothetical protein